MKAPNFKTHAMKTGRDQAKSVLKLRDKDEKRRKDVITKLKDPLIEETKVYRKGEASISHVTSASAGIIVAEGDSWFNYPQTDILYKLQVEHGYEVHSVARAGDEIEKMAYSDGQLVRFTNEIDRLLEKGKIPKAILLSGGGNDVAGGEFEVLLNHADSGLPAINNDVVKGIVDQRLSAAYFHLIAAVTEICKARLGAPMPIIVHGYAYPVPDGRGLLGQNFPSSILGPWLDPGFRDKGYGRTGSKELQRRIDITRVLIDALNVMLAAIPNAAGFQHVRYVDLRKELSCDLKGNAYQKDWANELHPTGPGFSRVTRKIAAAIEEPS